MDKTKSKKESVVKKLRQIRDEINEDIQHLSLEELKKYWSAQKTLHLRW